MIKPVSYFLRCLFSFLFSCSLYLIVVLITRHITNFYMSRRLHYYKSCFYLYNCSISDRMKVVIFFNVTFF